MFGWLGYRSFSSLNMEYQSIYYMTRYANPHSYIGIQPARTKGKLTHSDHAVGINHIALWAWSRVRRNLRVTDEPKEYPQYWPGYYAVFFDDPIKGIHWELVWMPKSLRLAKFGRSTGQSIAMPEVGRIWRKLCLALPGRRGEPCHPHSPRPTCRQSLQTVITLVDTD